ncbi:MAG: hypothetical protein A3H02_00460 [Candidatus Niyogibacteria bacterium RIFCSPLOWO2_12_FULL_41_13]|uniref:Uncharacterized protein n=1 Tax=Candidatus Niyogibacteria bacterium RIFCSPLOWO2_12_FULL_41_13 TaxID=1801726 RepID=A0A1G2F1T2_9BACT|nr:MAG: hypothetical protein A3H02_00460 [Candidatus Niyogibacteria bacterium RIFCSPLOWO2_12_FULL_41_13]
MRHVDNKIGLILGSMLVAALVALSVAWHIAFVFLFVLKNPPVEHFQYIMWGSPSATFIGASFGFYFLFRKCYTD